MQRTAGRPLVVSVALALVFWVFVLGLGLAFGGCGRKHRRTPTDTLVVVTDREIRDVDPRFAITSDDTRISRLVAPGLTTIDHPSLTPQPALAASLTPIDDVTWEVVLRDDVRFSDGTPVTAADVVFTYMSTLDPKTESLYRSGFAERIKSVEAIGERAVRFHLVEPVATLLSDLDFGIISEQAAKAGGGRFPGGKVIGAGAYHIASMSSERVLLERNPHYHGKPAATEKIEFHPVADANARALMLVGGSADITQNGVRLDLIDSIAERARIHVDSGPSAVLSYMMMQNQDPILDDVKVRRAIAHAIDRERILAAKLSGRAVLATGLLPPSHWAYEGNVPRYGYDPERSKALLDEAGYPDPDGPGGQPRMRLTYKTSADQFRLMLARVIATQLGEVGIAVEVRAFEFGTFFNDIKQGNYQLATMQTANITEPDYLYAYFHSDRIPNAEHPHTNNRWRYRNARVDELTAAGRRTADPKARVPVYAEVQKVLAEELPIIPLWHEDHVAVMNIDVRDFEILPSASFGGLLRAYKAEE